MNTLYITPTELEGSVCVPSSKSMGHREIICAALAEGLSVVDNVSISEDIEATIGALKALGAVIREVPSAYPGRQAFEIAGGKPRKSSARIDCGESGSTLRFLVPIAAVCEGTAVFTGRGRLASRPLDPYYDIFDKQGFSYHKDEAGGLPLTVSGTLKAGDYELPGNVSSQFVSGLLFALPLLQKDSVIRITSPLESRSYVDLTLSCLKKYGVQVENHDYGLFRVRGSQKYRAGNSAVEGDYSQAAFWLVAGLLGRRVACQGLNPASRQGDKAIISILKAMGGLIAGSADSSRVCASGAATKGVCIDAADCPDIIPVLAVLASVSAGKTEIINAGRLRIKECDRLHAIATELNKLGASVRELPEGLVIEGKDFLRGGGEVDCWNDHRIAMSLAIASSRCRKGFLMHGAECVRKSYPGFWQDFAALGGIMEGR